MYVPAHNKMEDAEEVLQFIRANPFAILVTSGKKLIATHIPIMLREINAKMYLVGHIAKGNSQRNEISTGSQALVIFPGPHAYISSSWYKQPDVPTWNYLSVHVYGTLSKLEQKDLTKEVGQLVDYFEEGRENRFEISQLEPETLKRDLKGIVGFRMTMEKIEGKEKLSQNRSEEDRKRVISGLESASDQESGIMATLMRKKYNY